MQVCNLFTPKQKDIDPETHIHILNHGQPRMVHRHIKTFKKIMALTIGVGTGSWGGGLGP